MASFFSTWHLFTCLRPCQKQDLLPQNDLINQARPEVSHGAGSAQQNNNKAIKTKKHPKIHALMCCGASKLPAPPKIENERSVATHGTQKHMVALHQVFVCLLRTPCLISPSAARESSGDGMENAQMDVLQEDSPHGRSNGGI